MTTTETFHACDLCPEIRMTAWGLARHRQRKHGTAKPAQRPGSVGAARNRLVYSCPCGRRMRHIGTYVWHRKHCDHSPVSQFTTLKTPGPDRTERFCDRCRAERRLCGLCLVRIMVGGGANAVDRGLGCASTQAPDPFRAEGVDTPSSAVA